MSYMESPTLTMASSHSPTCSRPIRRRTVRDSAALQQSMSPWDQPAKRGPLSNAGSTLSLRIIGVLRFCSPPLAKWVRQA